MPETTMPACFAPPLTDDALARYEALAKADQSGVGDAMRQLLACAKAWWALPESKKKSKPLVTLLHRDDPEGDREPALVRYVPLEDAHQKQLWDQTPWEHECEAMARLFDTIPVSNKPLRDAAHHLLWLVNELNLGREPMTRDRLPKAKGG